MQHFPTLRFGIKQPHAEPTPREREAAGNPPRWLLYFLLLFFLLTSRGIARGMDEVVMMTTLSNAWNQHTLAIDELSYLNSDERWVGSYGVGNHLYSKLPPGNALLAVPFYALGALISPELGAMLAVLFTNTILSTAGMLLLYRFLARHFKPSTALLTTLLVAICTDWWYQSRGFGSEIGAGVFLIGTLLAADSGHPLWSGLAFGLSVLFRPLNVLAFPVWLLNLFRTPKIERKTLLNAFYSMCLGGLVIATILAYNFLRFGNLLNFGYGHETFNTPPWLGLFYLLTSPGRSIFLYSPLFLLMFPGAYFWYQKDRVMAYAIASTVLLYLIAVASWSSWDGGWSWGSRLITPVVPLIGVLFAPVIEKAQQSKPLMALVGVFALIGLSIGALTLLKDPLWTMNHFVMSGMIPYEETLFTVRHSFLALHIQEIATNWHPMDLDGFFIRIIAFALGGKP